MQSWVSGLSIDLLIHDPGGERQPQPGWEVAFIEPGLKPPQEPATSGLLCGWAEAGEPLLLPGLLCYCKNPFGMFFVLH